MSVQLAAFNFIPAKFQSRPFLRPLTFGACTRILPHLLLPFPGLLVHSALVLLFSTLVDRGFGMYSGNTSNKSKKAAIFCLNIPLTKSIDHPWGSWERGSKMERHVLSSNNSYLHPFLPLCCCVVVSRTSALFLGELLRLKLFYASAPRAPIWKLLCVSFHTLLSYGALQSFAFYVLSARTSCRVFCFLWQIGHMKSTTFCLFYNFLKHLLCEYQNLCLWNVDLKLWPRWTLFYICCSNIKQHSLLNSVPCHRSLLHCIYNMSIISYTLSHCGDKYTKLARMNPSMRPSTVPDPPL